MCDFEHGKCGYIRRVGQPSTEKKEPSEKIPSGSILRILLKRVSTYRGRKENIKDRAEMVKIVQGRLDPPTPPS